MIDAEADHILIRQPEECTLERAQKILGNDKPVLVFHSGPCGHHRREERILVRRAHELAEGRRVVRLEPREYWPIMELMPAAGLVVAGRGYNTLGEVAALKVKAELIPFTRTVDRQSQRPVPRSFSGAPKAAAIIMGVLNVSSGLS